MALYNFQKRFAAKILSGEKRHTIRSTRKRITQSGELLHLYTGLRQKGAQLLMRARCTRVQTIEIIPGLVPACTQLWIDGTQCSADEFEQLARCDGFMSRFDMLQFWEGRLPFVGQIIYWKFPPESQSTREMGSCANVSALAAANQSRVPIASAQKIVDAMTTTRNGARSATRSAPANGNAQLVG
jgi:hypothetical protein